MPPPTPELLQGTLDVMVLSVLRGGAMHGYGAARRIEALCGGELRIEEGSLYPALRRLCGRGDVEAAWGKSGTGRRARFYSLTRAGERRLVEQRALWERLSGAVTRVLDADA